MTTEFKHPTQFLKPHLNATSSVKMRGTSPIPDMDHPHGHQPTVEGATWNDRYLHMQIVDRDTQRMVAAVQNWCMGFASNSKTANRLLVLSGRTGIGKTMAMRGALSYCKAARMEVWSRKFWQNPPDYVWSYWPKDADTDISDKRFWDELVVPHVRFIDDIGAEVDRFGKGVPTANLARLLGNVEGKWTMITTNVPPEQWVQRWDARVADRLRRGGSVEVFRDATSFAMRKDRK